MPRLQSLKFKLYSVDFQTMLKAPYLFILCLILLGTQACLHLPAYKQANDRAEITADSLQIISLIAKGKKFENSYVDSLPGVAWQLETISQFRNNKTGLIYAGIFKAYYYWLSVNYPTAMRITLQTMADAEQWQITTLLPELYSIMANIHKENGNYNAAFKDCEDGLNLSKSNKDTAFIISLLGLKAMFTHGYYRKNGRPQDDHTSLPMEFEALKMAESQPKYEKMRIRFYNNIGQYYKEQKQYANAIAYANKAIQLANKYHQPRSLTYSYNWLGEANYYIGRRGIGIKYMDSAIAVSRQAKLPYREMEIYEAMHWCYMSTKDYEPAIICLRRSTEMRDSLQIAKNEKQVAELQVKYNSDKKDKRIASLDELNLSKSRKILWTLIAMLLFIVLLVIILYQNFIINKNNLLIKTNNKILNDALLKIAHIQSHHIRKPLASIMGLMNIIKAHDYQVDKEVLQQMDKAAHDLDKRIRDVIKETEVGE